MYIYIYIYMYTCIHRLVSKTPMVAAFDRICTYIRI